MGVRVMRGIPAAVGRSLAVLSVAALAAIALLDVEPTNLDRATTDEPCMSQSLNGTWTNLDSQTSRLTRLEISYSCAEASRATRQGRGWEIAAWAKCHPSDCRWGRAVSVLPTNAEGASMTLAAAGSVTDMSSKSVDGFTARFEQGSASRTLTIRQIGEALEVEVATDFSNPHRLDYVSRERLTRNPRSEREAWGRVRVDIHLPNHSLCRNTAYAMTHQELPSEHLVCRMFGPAGWPTGRLSLCTR
jgi:hypothetical protein